MTVLVGILIPMAKVSVANRTLINPSEKSSSTISLAIGRRSPWWTAYPFKHILYKNWNWLIYWSSGFRLERALIILRWILDFSEWVVRSNPYILSAKALIFFFEKVKITQGNKFFFLQSVINYYKMRCSYLPSAVSISLLEIFFMNLSIAFFVISFILCSLLLSL